MTDISSLKALIGDLPCVLVAEEAEAKKKDPKHIPIRTYPEDGETLEMPYTPVDKDTLRKRSLENLKRTRNIK